VIAVDPTATGVPIQVDGPEGTETRDFHALRACFVSDLLRAGADLKQAMTLARHSDPKLTAARYARTRLHDLGAVVNKSPTDDPPSSVPAVLRMTGTDVGCHGREQQGAATSGNGQLRLRTRPNPTPTDPRLRNPRILQSLKTIEGN
jgi:hypothetical protein